MPGWRVSVSTLKNGAQRQLTRVKWTTPSSSLHRLGADSNLMDSSLAQSLVLRELLSTPLLAMALDGRLIAIVTHQTSPIQMCLPD